MTEVTFLSYEICCIHFEVDFSYLSGLVINIVHNIAYKNNKIWYCSKKVYRLIDYLT